MRLARIASTGSQQTIDADRERKQPKQANPAMGYGKSTPDPNYAEANDGSKTNVLACHDSSSRKPAGEEQGQQEGVINIRGSESRQACGQHQQIVTHKDLCLFIAVCGRLEYTSLRWRPLFPASTCSNGSTVAGVAHGLDESARQFRDAISLALANRFSRNQFSAHAQRNRARGNEAKRGTLIHSAGSDHRDVREHRFKIFYICVASDVAAWNDLDEIRGQLPSGDDAGRRQSSGNYHYILLYGELHGVGIEAVAGKELRARIETALGSLNIVDTSGAHDHFGSALHDMRNNLDRLGHGQRNFQNGDAAARDGLGGKHSVFHR